jgi:glucosamine--fructose-6-phosphate aminotransferase (isomerizing)
VRVAWSPDEVKLAGHSHFMHKEIHEQPSAIQRTFRHRVSTETAEVHLEGLSLTGRQLWDVNRMALVACGTSYHAGLIGRWFFESLARIPVDVDFSSEFRQRDLLLGPQDLCVFISQSGETADTLGALRAAKASGATALAVCNVPGSSLTRQADGVVLTSTGPEIGVASTKSFTAQIVALFLMALQAGRAKGLVTADQARSLLKNLVGLPAQMEELLQEEERIAGLAAVFHWCRDFFFLGRGLYYPVALEGALKLKEIAYVRAEAFPAGEMKHGPLALVDRTTTTVVIAPAGRMHSKMVSTIEEVKAREGNVIALCTKGDEATLPLVDRTLPLPSTSDYLMPCLVAIPLQLFAYHMAVLRGCDVDRPRNLAKSVTVD